MTKTKSSKPIRINPAETWYYLVPDYSEVVPIPDVIGDLGNSVVTGDGVEFPKADTFPSRKIALNAILSRLTKERKQIRDRLDWIDAKINAVSWGISREQ